MSLKCTFGFHDWAGYRCQRCGSVSRLDILLSQLVGPSESSQADALETLLGEHAPPELVDAILARYARSADPQAKKGAIVALGILGDVRAVEPLCKALAVEKENTTLLATLATSLRNLADERAAPLLTNWLASFDAQACKVGNTPRIQSIRITNNSVRELLNWMAHREILHAVTVLRAGDLMLYLVAALQDREHFVSEAAREAFGELPFSSLSPLMALARDTNLISERRVEAIDALGANGHAGILAIMQELLHHEDHGVSAAAVRALGRVSDLGALEPLVDLLSGADARLARCAAWALGELKDAGAASPLREALTHADPEVSLAAALALVTLGDPSGADTLVSLLSDQSRRKSAAGGLATLGDARCYEPLMAMLSSSDPWQRDEAAQALGRLGDPRAAPAIAKLLDDKERHVKLGAAAGLAMLGDLRGYPILLRGLWLSGICDHECRAAIAALGRCGDQRAVNQLVRALRGAPKKHRTLIHDALARFCTSAVDALIAELNDPRPIVRLHAVQALGAIPDLRSVQPLSKLVSQDADPAVQTAAHDAMNACRKLTPALVK